jgi:hypothetical protein
MPISVLVLFFGLCGLIAVFARVPAGRQALLVLIAFLTVATIWNWIDFALMATEFGASFPISYWMTSIFLALVGNLLACSWPNQIARPWGR